MSREMMQNIVNKVLNGANILTCKIMMLAGAYQILDWMSPEYTEMMFRPLVRLMQSTYIWQ